MAILQLRIELEDVTPPIWRRVLVDSDIRLDKLHAVLQTVMGWQDAHLHLFNIGDEAYGPGDDDADEDELLEDDFTLADALGDDRRFTYEYDFGDEWVHEVLVEDAASPPAGFKLALCLDGENACPPEDCGGAGTYMELMAKGDVDPTAFDLASINAKLQRLR